MRQLENKFCHIILNWCGLGDRADLDCDPDFAPPSIDSPEYLKPQTSIPFTESFNYGIQKVLGMLCYSTEMFKQCRRINRDKETEFCYGDHCIGRSGHFTHEIYTHVLCLALELEYASRVWNITFTGFE